MTYIPTHEKQTQSDREADARWIRDHDTSDVVDPAPNDEYAAPVASCAAAH